MRASQPDLILLHRVPEHDPDGRSDEAEYITEEYIQELEGEMLAAAESLEFERAAALRDRITQLRDSIGKKRDEVEIHATRANRGRSRGRGHALPALGRP